jgi:hypothetical protein
MSAFSVGLALYLFFKTCKVELSRLRVNLGYEVKGGEPNDVACVANESRLTRNQRLVPVRVQCSGKRVLCLCSAHKLR